MTEYNYPKLKTPPPPTYAFLDLDAPLFAAASAGEQVWYVAKDKEGKEVVRFDSAKKYSNWTELLVDMDGMDMEHGYQGEVEDLTRETVYEIEDFETCKKTFDNIVKDWVKQSGCQEWTGYVSKASGEKNFRYDVATVKGYKSSRGGRKPHYLEQVRAYAAQQPEIKKARGSVEVDDIVVALAQRKGWKGCIVGVDKDARGGQNTHILIPDEMEKPVFSSKKIVGRLYKNDSGKIVGYGTLFWIFQAIQGDSVDSIPGCKGVGKEGAFNLLKEFDQVGSEHLPEVIGVLCEAFRGSYGETYTYKHCTTGKRVTASYKDLAIEMSRLVYMKKNQKDDCFWIPLIEAYEPEELQNDSNS